MIINKQFGPFHYGYIEDDYRIYYFVINFSICYLQAMLRNKSGMRNIAFLWDGKFSPSIQLTIGLPFEYPNLKRTEEKIRFAIGIFAFTKYI